MLSHSHIDLKTVLLSKTLKMVTLMELWMCQDVTVPPRAPAGTANVCLKFFEGNYVFIPSYTFSVK